MTPDEALSLRAPTDGFLCPLSANVYGIDFLEFEIKDYDSGESVFHVKKDGDAGLPELPDDIDPEVERAIRTVRYRSRRSFCGSRRCGPRSCSASGRRPCRTSA